MSRTIKFAKAGGPEVLEFVEVQVPAPGPNEVRIKVKAIGINRAEAMWRVDDYIERVKFPAGLGYEAAGTVDVVGKDVGGFAVGDEVNVIPSFSLNDYSTYGEVILVPDHAVVRQPKSLSFTEAASVWMMFVTLLHGSVAGRSRPPAFAFMRDEGTLAALARACGLARRQQWPPRSSAALWSVSAARHRSLACSGRYRPPPGHANCNQMPAASPSDRARRSAADAGRAWSARSLPLRLAPRSNVAAQ